MTTYFIDTNILLRVSDSTSAMHQMAETAVEELLNQGHSLCITSQILIEFWAVATRPLNVNGLGWSVEKTRTEVEQLLEQFPLLEETEQIFSEWLNYVTTTKIIGKRTHDARLIAVMLVHGVTHILTFNVDDFKNTSGIVIVHPQEIITTE